MPTVRLPAPVALARPVDTLRPLGVDEPVWEPKWDGYGALYADGRLVSRRGTDLTRLFEDLAPVMAARLSSDLVLDGDIVASDTDAGRLDFNGLQARMTAGRRLAAVAKRRPAKFVASDLLAAGDDDLRTRPLRERRRVLEAALSGLASLIVLCQQTDDKSVAANGSRRRPPAASKGSSSRTAPRRTRQQLVSGCGGSGRHARRLT